MLVVVRLGIMGDSSFGVSGDSIGDGERDEI